MFILLLYCCSQNIVIRIPHTPLYVPLVHSLCSLFILDSIYQHTNTVHLLYRCYYEHTLINVCECHHLLCLLYLVTSLSLFSFLCPHVSVINLCHTVNLLHKRDCQSLQIVAFFQIKTVTKISDFFNILLSPISNSSTSDCVKSIKYPTKGSLWVNSGLQISTKIRSAKIIALAAF